MRGYSVDELDKAIEVIDAVREAAVHDPAYGLNDDWLTFMKKMRILTPQSSGARMQNYIFKALGWTRIPASANRGDVKNSLGQYFEVKVTIISSSNSCANIVQIRLWQPIAGHHVFVIDTTSGYSVTHFALSKYDMEQEVKLCGASAHGTQEANKSNLNVEWAIRIDWDAEDETYKRWMLKYRQDSEVAKLGVAK